MFTSPFILATLYLCLIKFEFTKKASAESCVIHVNNYVTKGKSLDGHIFWNSTAKDALDCAKQCIKRSICNSFNFDTLNRRCELNEVTLTDGMSTRNGNHLVYSDISSWPPEIDPGCYARPCGDDEVCVPGQLTGGTSCSYSCFKLDVRCPIPHGATDFTQSRTLGSIYEHTCGRGYVGGDAGRCLQSGEWNTTIDTTCAPLYGYSCTTTDDCLDIGGSCKDSICQCESPLAYDATTVTCTNVSNCSLADGSSYPIGHIYNYTCGSGYVGGDIAECLSSGQWDKDIDTTCTLSNCSLADGTSYPIGHIYNYTCGSGYVGGDIAECLSSGQWDKDIDTTCTLLHGSSCTNDIDCADINGTCLGNTCLCDQLQTYDTTMLYCVDKECEPGWVLFEQNCYLFASVELQYLDARTFCEDLGSLLVQVDSTGENEFLRDKMRTIQPKANYWNDLFELTTNGQEVWRTSGAPYDPDVSGWLSSPDDYLGKESCTIFWKSRDFQWVDFSCANDIRVDGTSYGYPDCRPVCEKNL